MMDASGEYIRKIQLHRRQTGTGRERRFQQYEIHALFDELIHRPWGRAQWHPPVDVREDDAAFIIEMDLPGVSAQDVRIAAEGNTLTISGRRRLRPCGDACMTHLCERPDGSFARKFEFHHEIRNERIESRWRDGVLTVTVPRPADDRK